MKPYVAICQIGADITVPVFSVHPDDQAAHDNAVRAVLAAVTEQQPELLSRALAVRVVPLADVTIREWLGHLMRERPDLIPSPPRVERGRPR